MGRPTAAVICLALMVTSACRADRVAGYVPPPGSGTTTLPRDSMVMHFFNFASGSPQPTFHVAGGRDVTRAYDEIAGPVAEPLTTNWGYVTGGALNNPRVFFVA